VSSMISTITHLNSFLNIFLLIKNNHMEFTMEERHDVNSTCSNNDVSYERTIICWKWSSEVNYQFECITYYKLLG
jgi:hypothetical protein